MTKEELKQEAEKWLCNNLHSASEEDFIKAMIDIAEPREKRIAVLEELLDKSGNSIKELEKENNVLAQNLEDSEIIITGLTAQIEKMKVCQNCDNWNWKHNKCQKKLKGDCFKHSKWVMRNF